MNLDAGAPPAPPGIARAAKTAPRRKGSRSNFVRTKVSVAERVISVLIVVLLVAAGGIIWYLGRHFDPNIYSLPSDALQSTESTVAGKASTLRVDAAQASEGATIKTPTVASAPAATGNSTTSGGDDSDAVMANQGGAVAAAPAGDSASSSADSSDGSGGGGGEGSGQTTPMDKTPLDINLPGIKPMGDTEFYDSDNLYQKIDGRSPAYQGFNCQELKCRTFSINGDGDSYVDVYEYRMDTNVNAFGIFALERDPKGKSLPFAKDGYSGDMGYYFRQGDIYVQIIASDQNPKTMQVALAVAENRAKVLPANDAGLDGRRALPSTGLEPSSVTFVGDDAQGQDFLKNVFQATYDFEGKKINYFIMATTPDAAASAWKSYLAFCGKYGGKATALPDVAGAKVFQASNFGTIKVIFQRDGQVGGVVDATDGKAALDFVTQHLQGQIQ